MKVQGKQTRERKASWSNGFTCSVLVVEKADVVFAVDESSYKYRDVHVHRDCSHNTHRVSMIHPPVYR